MPRVARRTAEWVQALDFRLALKNCHLDFLGDWYRDPWGWVELDWAVEDAVQDIVIPRMLSSGTRHAAKLAVAKENFGIRPAIVMDPLDRLCYQALVDSLSRRLIGRLPSWVYGWRLTHQSPRKGQYARQADEWGRFRSHLQRLAMYHQAALRTDIVSFFASVPISRICEDVLSEVRNAVSERLVDMLRGFDAIHGRSGLAQRSAASSALAHFYLTPLDEALLKHAEIKGLARSLAPEGRVLRWMDDVWIFDRSPGPVRQAQVELQSTMEDLGLRLNIAKTDVLEGDDVWTEANRIEHSDVDLGFASNPPDATPLGELIDHLLERPEYADRTSVRFATSRMRRHSQFQRVGEFVENAPRMPHASDHLARLFRDSGAWNDLQDWYVEYCGTPWACVDWSTAHLGTMFPSNEVGSGVVRDFLSEQIASPSLALSALAAQRLAFWDRDLARQAIRDAAHSANSPLARRVLALASVNAGEKRAAVRKLLGEFEENQLTLKMLEATGFRKPRVNSDFSGM